MAAKFIWAYVYSRRNDSPEENDEEGTNSRVGSSGAQQTGNNK